MSSFPPPPPLPPSNNKTVLITGINGYIASHLGLSLLRSGYTVRGTSRSPTTLLSPTGPFHPYSSRYTHLLIPDITISGAFDTAVAGVHFILHTASPVDFTLRTVSAFIHPAVQGNLSLLNSAVEFSGPQLESFVLTSSNAAVADRLAHPASEAFAYSEADWNNSALSLALESETSGNFAPHIAYSASKAAAERALWDWAAKHKPSWALCAVNPSVVTGPPVLWPDSPERLNETLLPIWRIFSGEATEVPPGIGGMSYVDVRDVVRLHVWCMEHRATGRWLCTNGKGTMQAVADILRKEYPERKIVVGTPGGDYREDYWFVEGEASMASTKAYTALGEERFEFDYRRSVLDTVRAFEGRWGSLLRNK
jgi:nucleoside-diphosphate-sugar epimerase